MSSSIPSKPRPDESLKARSLGMDRWTSAPVMAPLEMERSPVIGLGLPAPVPSGEGPASARFRYFHSLPEIGKPGFNQF